MASAHLFEIAGIYYNITDATAKTVEVTYYYNYNVPSVRKYYGNIVIPTSVSYEGKKYSVTSIGNYAFGNCDRLTSVTIPNSVTSIGYRAFSGCTGLTSVTIPNSVKSIGYNAFEGCIGLTSVIIGNSVTTIGRSAFYNCTNLTSITIPNSVKSIGENAFHNTAWYYIQPDGVVYIGKMLYKYKGAMPLNTSITIKEGTLGIVGYRAFSDCEGLTSVTIPNSVTSIGEEAFYGCTNLTSVEIPNSVTSIGDWAFSGCNIETVINLSPAFSLTAGSQECGWVASCAYKVINAPNGSILGNFVFQYIDGAETLVGYYGNDTKIKLPNSYNGGNYIVGDGAFANDVTITSLIISDSATSIGNGAFVGCTGLKKVDIVNAVTNVGESAFEGCTNLEALYISSNIESIGDKAFYGCDNLLDIKTGAIRAITANENVFSTSVYNNACLYVPKGRKFAYEKTTPWNKFFITEMDFTDIGDVETDDVLSSEKGVYYDLNGCPVNEPVKSGVYIRNGKKVLIR